MLNGRGKKSEKILHKKFLNINKYDNSSSDVESRRANIREQKKIVEDSLTLHIHPLYIS